jgi:hypothetical protein
MRHCGGNLQDHRRMIKYHRSISLDEVLAHIRAIVSTTSIRTARFVPNGQRNSPTYTDSFICPILRLRDQYCGPKNSHGCDGCGVSPCA